MSVYKGEQPYEEWLTLSRQGRLFEQPVIDKAAALKKLTILASRVIDDIGRDASWVDLKGALKDRAYPKIVYDSALIVRALDAAMRQRGEAAR